MTFTLHENFAELELARTERELAEERRLNQELVEVLQTLLAEEKERDDDDTVLLAARHDARTVLAKVKQS